MTDPLRRKFIKNLCGTGLFWRITDFAFLSSTAASRAGKKRVGIIGLDTSHSIEFTKLLNSPGVEMTFHGYKVVAAFPYGSHDIESSSSRIPGYIEEIKKMGVEITSSIADLLKKTDVILLETNDGRLHLQQALQVIRAGRPLYIDKPITASLKDALIIYEKADQYQVPVFSSSALRFIDGVQHVVKGEIGKVIGVDIYSPAYIEKTHPDFFWYGIHGIEMLFAVMGRGCKSVTRIHTEDTDVVVGIWPDGRIGTFRGLRYGQKDFGGTAFGEKEIRSLGKFEGYQPLLFQITSFFETGISPVNKNETLEIIAFMEAADKSKLGGGVPVNIEAIYEH